MGLTTFLFNDCVDSVTRTTRLAKYADEPGGRDYHWAAKQAASKLFYDDISYDQAVAEVMSNMSRPHQRKDNQDALKTIYAWKLANPGLAHAPPSGQITGPKTELVIVLKPAFALEKKGVVTAYVPWMFKDERLTANIAGIGVHLLELGLQKDAYENWRFALIDTVTGKCFSRTHKNTAQAARFMIRTQEELLIAQMEKKVA
jgi:hypothetical protein